MPLASVAYTVPETLTWETSTDWDNAVDEAGVVHEGFGDLPGAGTVQLGYPSFDRGGSGLLTFYTFDEDSGTTATDHSGNGNHGTINGPTLGAPGLHNSTTYNYDGKNDYVDVPTFHSGLSAFSISAWVNLDSTDDDWDAIYDTHDGTDMPIRLYVSGDSSPASGEFAVMVNSDTWVGGGVVPSAGTMYHVGATYDGSTVRMYVDGGEGGSNSQSGNLNTSTEATIGTEPSGNWPIDGRIEYFRFYNRALSSASMQAHADAGTGGHLETATKSFASVQKPNLQNLDYTLNGESLSVDVIGSPGTADEEVVTQALDGASSYSLSWSSSHTDFRVKPTISTTDETVSPTVNCLELVE